MTSNFTATVPLLVLAKATIPRVKNEKLCPFVVDCEIELRNIPRSETSVAFTIPATDIGSSSHFFERYGDVPHNRQNIVAHGESLFVDVGLSPAALVAKMRADRWFRPGRSRGVRDDFSREVRTKTPRAVWPDNLHRYASQTVNIAVSPEILDRMILEASTTAITPEGRSQIEDAKRRFQSDLSDIVVVDGRCHIRCGEPVYVHRAEERFPSVAIWNTAYWHGSGKANLPSSAAWRIYLSDEVDDMREAIVGRAEFREIGVVDSDYIRFPIGEMEFFRIARELVQDLSFRLGKPDVIINSDRETLNAFVDIRDLIQACDPLVDGIPAEIEEKFEAIVACLPRIETSKQDIRVGPQDIDYARSQWENRPIIASVFTARGNANAQKPV
jgi:hypothetical protein